MLIIEKSIKESLFQVSEASWEMETNPMPATYLDYFRNMYDIIGCAAESAECISNGGWACIPTAMKSQCFMNDPTLCPSTGICTCCGSNFFIFFFYKLIYYSFLKYNLRLKNTF